MSFPTVRRFVLAVKLGFLWMRAADCKTKGDYVGALANIRRAHKLGFGRLAPKFHLLAGSCFLGKKSYVRAASHLVLGYALLTKSTVFCSAETEYLKMAAVQRIGICRRMARITIDRDYDAESRAFSIRDVPQGTQAIFPDLSKTKLGG